MTMQFHTQKNVAPAQEGSAGLKTAGLLQRKCVCGGAPGLSGDCAECQENYLQRKSLGSTNLAISEPGDPQEREADRIADAVMSGGAAEVRSAGAGPALQRQTPGAPGKLPPDAKYPPGPGPSEEEKYKEAAKKIAEALRKTQAGKELEEQASKLGEKFLDSVEGKVITGTAIAGAVAAAIETNADLPDLPIPEIPLDFIKPGLKAKLTWQGPARDPKSASLTLTSKAGVSVGATYKQSEGKEGKPGETRAGLTLTIPLGGSAKKSGPSDQEKRRAETARLQAEHAKFREGLKSPTDRARDAEFWDMYWKSKMRDPLNPLALPRGGDRAQKEKKEDETLSRKAIGPASTHDSIPPLVHEVLNSSGEPLEPTTKHFFEARFGHDFSRVRIHSGAAAEESARQVNASAYTVGHNIVFGAGQFAPGTEAGRRLLAHELAHVVQQSKEKRSSHNPPAEGETSAVPPRAGHPFGATGSGRSLGQRNTSIVQRPAPLSPFNPEITGAGKELARQPTKVNVNALAPALAKKLREKKRNEVLSAIENLGQADRDALDAAAARLLTRDQSEALRRVIRFVRHKPGAMPAKDVVTVVDPGTAEPKAKADKVAAGAVEFHRGVSMQSGASTSTEAFSLTYKGTDAADMRWLQFIWRSVVAEFPAATRRGRPRKIPLRKKLQHGKNVYHLTTNPAQPSWNTDSVSGGSAFYEDNTTVNRAADQLAMFDAPSSMQSDAAGFFTGGNAPDRVVSHFHASTYLIRGMDVLYRVEIDVAWEFTSENIKKKVPGKITAKKNAAVSMDPAHRARLLAQYPDVDYLPGAPLAAPRIMDEFDPVPDLAPAGAIQEKDWKSKTDLDRYEDIAALAHAEWIDDVSGMSAMTINNVGKTGAVRAGLNYNDKLPVQGEGGYIDAAGKFTNPDLPVTAEGQLPRVAIVLGPLAFARDKAFALATLRHEMAHAAHHQLAIGWLVKWRDDRSGKSFRDWLAEERGKKRISELDHELVLAGVASDLRATETLAWTEGFVTALPFLRAKPAFSLVASGDFPAAISALKGAGKFYRSVSSAAVKKAALARIYQFSCSALKQSQRDAVIEWVGFLLNPNSLNPTQADKPVVTLINNDFSPIKPFLNDVLANMKKACAK
jgi:hypothetical protein